MDFFTCNLCLLKTKPTAGKMAGRGRSKKVFTSCEVSWHNSTGDLWIVIDNKVYDISEFVYEVGAP